MTDNFTNEIAWANQLSSGSITDESTASSSSQSTLTSDIYSDFTNYFAQVIGNGGTVSPGLNTQAGFVTTLNSLGGFFTIALNNAVNSPNFSSDPFGTFFGLLASGFVTQGTPAATYADTNGLGGLLGEFESATNSSLNSSEFTALLTGMGLSTAPANLGASAETYINGVFGAFMQAELAGHNSTNTVPTTLTQLLNDWVSFTTVTATLTTSAATGTLSGYPSYEAYYDQYYPDSGFQAFLNNFIKTETSANGYFLPSQFYTAFTVAVTSQVDSQEGWLAPNDSAKVAVALQLVDLMISFIGTIQTTAIAQSKLLNFYTDWEQSYTTEANYIPTFTSTNHGPYNTGDTIDIGTANAQNQAYAQNLRDFRSIVNDNAQNIQSDINQSNQSVNQQVNLITQILQEFGTILQGIFH